MAIGSRLQHVIESQQFSRLLLEELLARADDIKSEPHKFSGRLNGRVMAALFYESSTPATGQASIPRRRCSTCTPSATSSATSTASASPWSETSPTAARSGR